MTLNFWRKFFPSTQNTAQNIAPVASGKKGAMAFYAEDGATVSPSAVFSDSPGMLNSTFDQKGTVEEPFTITCQTQQTHNISGPGMSLGNAGGWTTELSDNVLANCARRGIHEGRSTILTKHAVGDTAGQYSYVYDDGGVCSQSDEGVTAGTFQAWENPDHFKAQIASTTGRGDTSPTYKNLTGADHTTDGAYMLNISKGTVSGNMLKPSEPFLNTFLRYIPVTENCLPVSEAVGVMISPQIPTTGRTRAYSEERTITVKLLPISGVLKKFTAGSCVSVAGNWYPEQAKLKSVVDNNDGTMQLVLNLSNPHQKAVIFQGGIAGHFISFDANLNFSGRRSSYFAFGSVQGNDLICGCQVTGSLEVQSIPMTGNEAAAADGGKNSGFHLYPGAEIITNNSMKYDCVLEPNNVDWEANDFVENPHFSIWGGTNLWSVRQQDSPSSPHFGMLGLSVQVNGKGFGGANVALMRGMCENPSTDYIPDGGPLIPPVCFQMMGSFSSGVLFYNAPSRALLQVYNPAAPVTNPDATICLVDLNRENSPIIFDPVSQQWQFGAINAGDLRVQGERVSTYTPPQTTSPDYIKEDYIAAVTDRYIGFRGQSKDVVCTLASLNFGDEVMVLNNDNTFKVKLAASADTQLNSGAVNGLELAPGDCVVLRCATRQFYTIVSRYVHTI